MPSSARFSRRDTCTCDMPRRSPVCCCVISLKYRIIIILRSFSLRLISISRISITSTRRDSSSALSSDTGSFTHDDINDSSSRLAVDVMAVRAQAFLIFLHECISSLLPARLCGGSARISVQILLQHP